MNSRWLGRISFQSALTLQNDLVAQRHDGAIPDTALFLEHEPVYTIGRRRDQSSLPDNRSVLPHPVAETNRGGQATYHGPGQLVGYFIIDLRERAKDLHAHLRWIEQLLIDHLASIGLAARRRPELTGVWIGDRKIASIGVGVRRWVTMHGFALNVSAESLPPFQFITPCGIQGVTMTSIESELGSPRSTESTAGAIAAAAAR